MSVLIKGINMPECCDWKCPFYEQCPVRPIGHGDYIPQSMSFVPRSVEMIDGRAKDCPLVEVKDEEFEWCTDCKEYDHDRHCCSRFSRVINTTLQDIRVAVVEDIIELISNAAVVSPSKDYRDGFDAFKEVLVEVIKERYPDAN